MKWLAGALATFLSKTVQITYIFRDLDLSKYNLVINKVGLSVQHTVAKAGAGSSSGSTCQCQLICPPAWLPSVLVKV